MNEDCLTPSFVIEEDHDFQSALGLRSQLRTSTSSSFASQAMLVWLDVERKLEAEFNRIQLDSFKVLWKKSMRSGDGAKLNAKMCAISPFDDNRVTLTASGLPPEEDPTFVNASHMDDEIPCIAAAMPFNDVMRRDFWRMVVEQNAKVVVMLNLHTQLDAGPYWPENVGDSIVLRNTLRVTLDSMTSMSSPEEVYANVRTLSISTRSAIPLADSDGAISGMDAALHSSIELLSRSEEGFSAWSKPHVVTHLNYLQWPDMSVPDSEGQFLNFFLSASRMIQDHQPSPVVVHCLAGAGRTGSFLAILTAFHKMRRYGGRAFNFAQLLTMMRTKRSKQVETLEQYKFCYRVLLTLYEDRRLFHRSLASLLSAISTTR